jgi:peptidyl-prolyl cis-trans isomerase B (cyclophilin B)
MITSIALALVALAPRAGADIKFDAPKVFVGGTDFHVTVHVVAPKDGIDLPSWMLETSAFTIDGKPLADRVEGHPMKLGAGAKIDIELDLGPHIASSKAFHQKNFKLGYGQEGNGTEPIEVRYMQAVEKGLDFLKMSPDELAKFHVLMQTSGGDIEIEFWPDVAPKHVANFLDLSYTGFYNGLTFHRVIPGFMIQGGDPTGTGTGNGPRTLKAEFSKKKHERGVLSMARSASPDSASCQFFVMHAAYPSLDGQYSAFGKVVSGIEAVDKIVNTKRNSSDKPLEPQTITKCIVIRAPTK